MKKNKLVIIIVFGLAFFLRVWSLNKVPPELFGDELDVGYHAYSILKTGRDYYGQLMPVYVHSFSEWRAPLLMYITVPFIAIFGLNEWGVRLPSAIFGFASVLIIYILVKEIRGKPEGEKWKLEIIAAFFLATSPWHLQYSRAAFEASLLLFLILSASYLFLKGIKKNYLLIFSAIIFSLTFYTYSTANIFTPLFIMLLVFVYKDKLRLVNKKMLLISFLTFFVFSLPIAKNIFFGHAGDRFQLFSVFSDTTTVSNINSERLEAGNTFLERLTHNKPISWTRVLLSNYTNAFSSKFLFVEGDVTFRHSIHFGELYWVLLPFVLIGLFELAKSEGRERMFWLGWLLLAPIPSSLTRDGSVHATRLFLMLPPLMYLAAKGTIWVKAIKTSIFLRRIIINVLIMVFLLEFFLYLHQYWIHYPKQSWRWWHIGYKESMTFIKDNEDDYDLIIFNNTYEPSLIRFLFWNKYPPDKFLIDFRGDIENENILPNFKGFKLGEKYYFGSAKDIPGGVIGFLKPGMIYMVSQRDEVGGDWDWEMNPPGNIKVLKTVRNPYSEVIFYVVTAK